MKSVCKQYEHTGMQAVTSRQSPRQLTQNAPKHAFSIGIFYREGAQPPSHAPHPTGDGAASPHPNPYRPPHFIVPGDAPGDLRDVFFRFQRISVVVLVQCVDQPE